MGKLAELVELRTQGAERISEELEQAQAVLLPDARQGNCTFTVVTESSECEYHPSNISGNFSCNLRMQERYI